MHKNGYTKAYGGCKSPLPPTKKRDRIGEKTGEEWRRLKEKRCVRDREREKKKRRGTVLYIGGDRGPRYLISVGCSS